MENKVMKILLIANSHGLDATTLLHKVFKAEMPEQKLVIGALYQSGCPIGRHAEYIRDNEAAYIYFKCGDYEGALPDSLWTASYDEGTKEGFLATVEYALKDEQWDLVVMQQMNRQSGVQIEKLAERSEDERVFWTPFVAADFKTIIDLVNKNVTPKPKFAWHMTWANPDGKEYLAGEGSDPRLSLNVGWGVDHKWLFPGEDGEFNSRVMYDAVLANVKKYLLQPSDFPYAGFFDMIFPSATTIQYAADAQGLTQAQIYRDYTHLSDYSRLMVSYLWYVMLREMITGEEIALSEIKLTKIPNNLHTAKKSKYPPVNADGDFDITEEMKQKILEAVNWTLENPYTLPC